MGLPLCRDPPTSPPPKTERDPTASARSHIRRRLHRRRGVTSSSDLLRRSRLDPDRRSSQQVLLDLLQFTQDGGNSSHSNANGGLSSAATTASSNVSVSSSSAAVDAPTGSASAVARPPYYSRFNVLSDIPSLASLEMQMEEEGEGDMQNTGGDHYDPTVFAPQNAYPLILSPVLRVLRQSPPFVSAEDRDRERETTRERAIHREREVQRDLAREIERSREANENMRRELERRRERNDDVLRELRRTFGLGSASGGETEEGERSLGRNGERERTQERMMHSARLRVRRLGEAAEAAMSVTDVTGRRRGEVGAVDGLGDRERSLSPDRSPWSYFPTSFTDFPISVPDLSTNCDYGSDNEEEVDGPVFQFTSNNSRRREGESNWDNVVFGYVGDPPGPDYFERRDRLARLLNRGVDGVGEGSGDAGREVNA